MNREMRHWPRCHSKPVIEGISFDPVSFRAGSQTGVRIPRMKSTAKRQPLPPAFMRGEGHEVAGGVLRRSGKASSVTASPCQLPQRGSQGGCAPFLPPAFMRGEGHEVAGGVPRRSGESPLSRAARANSPRGRAKGKKTGLLPSPLLTGRVPY